MTAIPVKVVGEDFLANHIGQLLIRQPCPTKDDATPRQKPATKPNGSTVRLSDPSRSWVALEHVSSIPMRASQSTSSGSLRGSVGSAHSGSGSIASGSAGARAESRNKDNIGSTNSGGCDSRIEDRSEGIRARSKEAGSEPDLSAQVQDYDVFDRSRHRRTGSEALVSPRISFTTSFGAKPRKSRSRRESITVLDEVGGYRLDRRGSVKSSISSANSNGSISPLDFHVKSPWTFHSNNASPLGTVDEGSAHQQWSEVLSRNTFQAMDLSLNHKHLKQQQSFDRKESCQDEAEASKPVEPQNSLRAATSPSPVSTVSSLDEPSTPMSHQSTSLSGIETGEVLSRRGSLHQRKLSLVPKGGDGRTFRFVEPASEANSDAEDPTSVAPHPTDANGFPDLNLHHAASSETLGPARASRALSAAMGLEDPVAQPESQPKSDAAPTPKLDAASTPTSTAHSHGTPPAAPATDSRKKHVRKLSLLERTMAAERNASGKVVEILGQKIERRGAAPPRAREQHATTHARAGASGQRSGGYGEGKRTFQLRPAGDSLSMLDSAIPVVLPKDYPRSNVEDRTSRWAREHGHLADSSENHKGSTLGLASPSPLPLLASSAQPHSRIPHTARESSGPETPTDYFSPRSPARTVARRDHRHTAATTLQSGASFMTHTTSSTSTSTDASNILEMAELDTKLSLATLTPPETPESSPSSVGLAPEKKVGYVAPTLTL